MSTSKSFCPPDDKICAHQEQVLYECSVQCATQQTSNQDQVWCFQQKCAHEATLLSTFDFQMSISSCALKDDLKQKSNYFKKFQLCQNTQISPCDKQNSTCVNMITDIKICFKSCLEKDDTSNSYGSQYLVQASTQFEMCMRTNKASCPLNDKNCVRQQKVLNQCAVMCANQQSSNQDQVWCFQQKCAHEATLISTFNFQMYISGCALKEDLKQKSSYFKHFYQCQNTQISPCDRQNSTCVNMIADIKSCFKNCLKKDDSSNSYNSYSCIQTTCSSNEKIQQIRKQKQKQKLIVMKYLVIRLILYVSLPIIIGVAFVLTSFYNLLWKALDQWQLDSGIWIKQTQEQILYNSAFSSQILFEYSFNQFEIHMVVMKSLLEKYQKGSINYSPLTNYTLCSYKEFMFNQCPQNVYDQMNKSIFYADLYYVRSGFKLNLLTPEQKYFIKMNVDISFYGKAAFLATQTEGLIQISNIYNSDTTSVQSSAPSILYNYTQASYQHCKGDNFTEPYDARCRFWFLYAQNNQGMFILKPFNDALTGALQLSLITSILYQQQLYSVDSMSFQIQNLVQLFDSSQSQNSYSVLFHEFNSTVLYHPLVVFDQVMSFADIEYLNINQFCSNSQKQKDYCNSQKQQFSKQVNDTIDYIKTSKYSIENKTNLSQLYQYWERFGQKQMSIIFPIQSKLNGLNNQQPYSYAIIMIAKVITDNTEIKQQFMQKIQSNKSIYQKQNSIFSKSIQNGSPKNAQISINQSQQGLNYLNREEDSSLDQSQYLSNQNFLKNKLGKINEDQFKSHFNQPKKYKSIKYDAQNVNNQQALRRRNISNSDQSQSICKNDYTMSISSSFRSRIQNSNISNQYYEVEQTKQKDKDRILRGLKPLFFEMKIIKKVFQDLESLVNYQIDAQNQNQQDSMNALFHFSKAKSTFLQLRNQTGLSRCYYNLGILKMLKNNFILAQEYFESAINLSIEAFGTGFQSLQSQKILQQHNQSADNYIIMVFKQLLSKSYSLKQQALDLIYQDDSQKEIYDHKYDDFTYISQKTTIKQLQNYSLEINKLLIQSLRAFESAQKLVHNNDQSFSEIQKIFLFQEIIEILTYLKQSEKTQSQLFSLVKQLLLTAEQKISNNFNLFRGANFYTNKQVLQIQNAKQYFLQGLKEYFQNNLILAFELFTLCLEEGTHYDPFLKKKAMFYINQLTKQTMRLPQQDDSGIWIIQTQQQILYNSIYSQQILLEYSFNQLELHMVAMKGLLNKYQSGQMIYRTQTSYTYCSYREFMFDECPKNVYSQINESLFYAQLYFVRSLFKYELLTPEQKYFIKMNEDLSFYSGAAFLASQSDGLIQISNIYNSDQTSLQIPSPSVMYNYTQASYQTCNGDSFIEPYDARCRFWFQYAKQYPGIFIYQPYNDALTGTLELSLSSQVLKDSQFYSVHTINFVMQNLVDIFNSYLSQNQFSVLFHEFNTTVLYHPLLVFYQKMTWVDVEFLNINQFCGYNLEQLELCNNQKEQLSSQVNETIQFIKTGNYSIENQINLGQLYQYWERFGQKQVSIVFPIQSNLKGLNNQFPYSYSIIMIARVITDQNENSADQSQHINFSNQQSKFYKQSNDQYKSQNNSLQVKQINHKTDSQTQKDVSQISTKKIPQSSEKIYESSQQSNLIQKNSQSFEQSYSVNKNNCSLNTSNFKDKTQRSKNSELEDELYQKKFENKNTFLQELKPLFLEMKIIKDVFKDLESLINYSIEAQNQNSENSTKTFFHFCKAKCTFQQLKNQIGLGRCYYNLGIVSLLNYDYNLAKEYFETAIFLSFESLGTNYNNIINQKIIKQCQNNTENQILIVSKRIFSKAYCLKQQALQKYYIYENIDFENQENIQHSKIKRRHLLQIKQQIYSSEQIQLLKQSLETFQIVLSFVQNNNYNFSEIFQIFLYQEIIEILIFLNFNNNNSHKISRYIKTVNQIIINSKYQYAYISEAWQKASLEQKKYYKQSIMSENNFDINKQIMQIQKSKQLFLLALNEQFKNNYFGAIELFIQSLEEGTHYSPSLRKKITCHLSQLINLISDIPFKQMLDCDDESFLFKKQNSHIDLIVILQLDYYKQHSTVEICLKAIQQSNLLNSSDRIQILIYDSNITTLMPFTNIHNINHWNLIINSFKDLEQLIQKDEVNKKQQLTWQEALFQSINFIYDVNQSDLVSLKQNFYYDQTNQKNDLENSNSNPNNEQVFKNILLNNPNKVILLFSKDQETDQTIQFAQNYQTKLKLIKFKKPIIYHLKEYPLIQSIIPNFNFPDMIYEYFYDENILIANLTKLKNEEILNDEYEFLSILNNS
ncbi:hypothetical protein ABPG74_019614 [Tetrahymena malaccensis]